MPPGCRNIVAPFGLYDYLFVAVAIIAVVVLISGCAAPHRVGTAVHELRQYTGRNDGLISEEVWKDSEKGGGWFLLTTSSVQSLHARHDNQPALGGSSDFSAGPISITGDPATVNALGSAIGKVVGEALKTSVNPIP